MSKSRIVVIVLAGIVTLALAGSALATTTWSSPDGSSSLATTTTGTEAAPTLSTQGFNVSGMSGYSVHVDSVCVVGDGGCTYPLFSKGKLLGYAYNPVAAKWGRAPELDCEVPATNAASCPGYGVPNPGAGSRVAFIPSGLGVAARVYIVGNRGAPVAAVPRADTTRLVDGNGRTVVATGVITGSCLGADLTTTSAAGPTIPAGAEYRLCALTDLWVRYDGEAATADAPSEPLFARTCIVRGPYSAERSTTAILPAGATALSGKEIVACPVTRPQ